MSDNGIISIIDNLQNLQQEIFRSSSKMISFFLIEFAFPNYSLDVIIKNVLGSVFPCAGL